MQAPDTIFGPTKTKAASERIFYGIDGTRLLKGAELFTLVQSIAAAVNAAGLTIETPAVNGSTFLDDYQNTVAVQKGILVWISGGAVGQTYEILFPAGTTAGATRTPGIRIFIER